MTAEIDNGVDHLSALGMMHALQLGPPIGSTSSQFAIQFANQEPPLLSPFHLVTNSKPLILGGPRLFILE
jgi:hypothetical protein